MELNPELRNAIMIFYLVLRALDTIEDDMSIDPKIKIPLLRSFHEKLLLKDWTFNGNADTEKDKIVLVKFNNILTEYSKLKPEYQDIIKDITEKMGNGMADYINNEDFNLNGVKTIADYDLYCYYVAGLVGFGLTKLGVASNFSDPYLLDHMELSKSMGLFLQKTNIIRDYKEDQLDGRSFWPEEIWSKYADKLSDFTKSENQEKGLYCITDLVLNSMSHIKDVLVYLTMVYDHSTFNFCAIPQVMAIATLAEVFQNKNVLNTNVKIRKGKACELILKSRTYEDVLKVFSDYLRIIHHKCPVSDPNYLSIGIMCGELEQFIEELNPNPAHLPKGVKPMETPNYLRALKKKESDVDMARVVKVEYWGSYIVMTFVGLSLISIMYTCCDILGFL
ncbi:terpene cyclase [Pichia californica]|uniref:Squalene synthase n=1 Tax=Pichia californica TaxID=460514 RepID=A0A9P7BD26_9ASCO|nr:terpene cyclase [[Candida] californica]KAG0687602.1 terpene cyclase [[Candida] californica]